jgi:hypothetical protein
MTVRANGVRSLTAASLLQSIATQLGEPDSPLSDHRVRMAFVLVTTNAVRQASRDPAPPALRWISHIKYLSQPECDTSFAK